MLFLTWCAWYQYHVTMLAWDLINLNYITTYSWPGLDWLCLHAVRTPWLNQLLLHFRVPDKFVVSGDWLGAGRWEYYHGVWSNDITVTATLGACETFRGSGSQVFVVINHTIIIATQICIAIDLVIKTIYILQWISDFLFLSLDPVASADLLACSLQ